MAVPGRCASTLEVDIDATSPTPRVAVFGTCTGQAAGQFMSALAAACSSHPRRLVVDLNGLEHIDGQSMARLLDFRRSRSGTVVTFDVQGLPGRRLMEIMAAASTYAA
jgi:ABC-type transporter Mla MlaB component